MNIRERRLNSCSVSIILLVASFVISVVFAANLNSIEISTPPHTYNESSNTNQTVPTQINQNTTTATSSNQTEIKEIKTTLEPTEETPTDSTAHSSLKPRAINLWDNYSNWKRPPGLKQTPADDPVTNELCNREGGICLSDSECAPKDRVQDDTDQTPMCVGHKDGVRCCQSIAGVKDCKSLHGDCEPLSRCSIAPHKLNTECDNDNKVCCFYEKK